MKLIISNRNPSPIYEQIVDQLKEKILSGELEGGSLLPSIRSLARDLRISVITTKRAYEELEKEGLIVTVPAKGCFVAEKNKDYLREERLRKIEAALFQAITEAQKCALEKEDLWTMLSTLWEEEKMA